MGKIDLVHTDRTPQELAKYREMGRDHKFEFAQQEISVRVYDFRSDEVKKASEINPEMTKLSMYFMGFAQSEMESPHDLTGAIIDKARANGEVLLIPRFKDLPVVGNIEDEVLMSSLGVSSNLDESVEKVREMLKQSLEQDKIPIDLGRQSITLYGFSDGNRTLVQMCGHINAITPKYGVDGKLPDRKMVSLSSTSIIDEASRERLPTGKTHTERFNKQVFWAAIEETRLRLNYLIDAEKKIFEQDFYHECESRGVKENAQEMENLRSELSLKKDESGRGVYPFLAHDLKHVNDAEEAWDQTMTAEVLKAVAMLNSFREGREIFLHQFKESAKDNLGMLYDMLQRAATGGRKQSYEQLGQMRKEGFWRFLQFLWEGYQARSAIDAQFANAEYRQDEICNGLETFDVECLWPREDLIAPDVAYGQTVWRILKEDYKGGLEPMLDRLPGEVQAELVLAIQSGDKERLGKIFLENISSCIKLLFPNARSVYGETIGRRGGMDGSHLAATKSAGLYGLNP